MIMADGGPIHGDETLLCQGGPGLSPLLDSPDLFKIKREKMRLHTDQIERLSHRIIQQLLAEQLAEMKGTEATLSEVIITILQDFQETAAAIENQVHKMMAQYARQIEAGHLDTQQMYGMIRKQVAKEKKFELNPEDQINVLSHRIHDRLYNDDLLDYTDEDKALRLIKRILNSTLRAEDELDEQVRTKIRSLKRPVPEGSPEWQALYQRYMDEELAKRRL